MRGNVTVAEHADKNWPEETQKRLSRSRGPRGKKGSLWRKKLEKDFAPDKIKHK